MATYAIGDIQGCHSELIQLLDKLQFSPANDRLWFVGDLVNRGPGSLQVLRLVQSLGDNAISVLGNHDLHLLAVHAGAAETHRNDTLGEVLRAPDCDDLLHWLRHRPLLHSAGNNVLVHAGLLPQWDIAKAASLAAEVEAALRGSDYIEFLSNMYGNKPRIWRDDLKDYDRLRVIVNALTRLRICTSAGEMDFKFKGVLEEIPDDYLPWFDVAHRRSKAQTVVFGHWSALRLRVAPNLIALDTGCVWGGPLTAIRLEDRELFQVPSTRLDAKRW